MTKDEALTMIIASIAMEEEALSHILNAEGEKLQYVLGTLPGVKGLCANAQEVLAVNKSVKDLLDTVMQNQLLLRGKLEAALEAGGWPPVPPPPGPCGPNCPDKPSCELCCRKSAIHLASRCSGFFWGNDSLMTWKRQGQIGRGIRWDEKTPTLVYLDPKKIYALNFTINARASFPGDSAGTVSVKLTPGSAFLDILPLNFSVKCLKCKPVTLHYSTTLFPKACSTSNASLALLLHYDDSLFVDQASLSIVEL